MTDILPIHLAVEDQLSENILREIIKQSGREFYIGACYRHGGFGYLKKKASGFNNASRGVPILMLTDLDKNECPPSLIAEWLPTPINDNFLFRVAVIEVESWVLAHRKAFSKFLGIKSSLIPINTDRITDPKQTLINLTRRSRRRAIREAIVPVSGSTATIGPDYNGTLSFFIQDKWSAEQAAKCSDSLSRTYDCIKKFTPIYKK